MKILYVVPMLSTAILVWLCDYWLLSIFSTEERIGLLAMGFMLSWMLWVTLSLTVEDKRT